MVSFRPHTLDLYREGGGTYNSNGDWIPDAESLVRTGIPCRYEPNGKALTITLQDGQAYRYSYMVYLNVDTSLEIHFGDHIELTSQDGIKIGRFEVKGFHRGQLDMKVWV